MNIDNNEIERLMRVLSTSFKKAYEKNKLNGRKLDDVRQEREQAIETRKLMNKRAQWLSPIRAIALIATVAWCMWHERLSAPGPSLAATITIVCLLTAIIVTSWTLYRYEKKDQDANQVLIDCNKIFIDLGEALWKLNPMGTGNRHYDIIDKEYVIEKLGTLAFRIVDAEELFEAERIKPKEELLRWDVVRSGQWVEKCQADFDKTWETLPVFDLSFNKRSIFHDAAIQLARNPRRKKS